MWFRNVWQPHTCFSLPIVCTAFAWRTPSPIHLKLPQPIELTLKHRTLKKFRCVVCFFYKHIRILDIQCISQFSVLSGGEKIYDFFFLIKVIWIAYCFCQFQKLCVGNLLCKNNQLECFVYLAIQCRSTPFNLPRYASQTGAGVTCRHQWDSFDKPLSWCIKLTWKWKHIKKALEKCRDKWEWEFILMYKIHFHFSIHLGNHKEKKKRIKNHVCILFHREALSAVHCVLLQADSDWYLLQGGYKRSTCILTWQSFRVLSIFRITSKCGVKGLCHWSERNYGSMSLNGEWRSHKEALFNHVVQAVLPCIRWGTKQTQER